MINTLKRIKILTEAYNLFNHNKLSYLKPLYMKYGLKKQFFQSISSKDFPRNESQNLPLFDKVNSADELPNKLSFKALPEGIKKELLSWSNEGFALLKDFFSENEVEFINEKINELAKSNKLQIREERKMMFAVDHSKDLRSMASPDRLEKILELLMGCPISLFQSVNFFKGSEDPAHSDFIHMTTYPYGYLIAAWIALEDIDLENGPLFYYPRSHKLNYIMNGDFDHGGNKWLLGKSYKKKYSDKIDTVLSENKFEKKYFTAKKGDVLIWHANLLHGGSKVIDPERTRKSMVMHYFGKDVIRYHEVSQRPSFSNELSQNK
ncbi:MAG: phytanoyl-CoA dioxygenase family protein [Cyclobacterium sp.]|uniref:phytanoyl-CoA dioxygenase family protein n=1 Tax=Cyclobacterium sp. TaxID=1966343 RepID=UPI0039707157